jgi:transcriptional regulator with XRE-family HTH domain
MRDLPPKQRAALRRAGAELRDWREQLDISQQDVSDIMGWTGRAATSKLEAGQLNISLADYLELVLWYRDTARADHPAVRLAEHLLGPPSRQ